MEILEGIREILFALKERIVYTLDPHKRNEEVEYLKLLVEQERHEKIKIIEMLSAKAGVEEATDSTDYKPINQYKPWHQIRAELEKRDRKPPVAAIITDKIKELEEELEISNAK